MRAYHLRLNGIATSVPAPALPDKPSIAVLPFLNMSGDQEQEYFVDGMTEDLITDLSKVSGLFVIARNSSFTYKGKAVDVKRIGREQRSSCARRQRPQGRQSRAYHSAADRCQRRASLGERFDRDLTDIFSMEDEVVEKIVRALAVTLTRAKSNCCADAVPATSMHTSSGCVDGNCSLAARATRLSKPGQCTAERSRST